MTLNQENKYFFFSLINTSCLWKMVEPLMAQLSLNFGDVCNIKWSVDEREPIL